jgi:hypothetical protein
MLTNNVVKSVRLSSEHDDGDALVMEMVMKMMELLERFLPRLRDL